MRFACLIAFVPEDLEEEVRDVAKDNGAAGVTVINGRGKSSKDKKGFLGISYEESHSVLLYVLERKICLKILKSVKDILCKEENGGIAFSMPIDHLVGIKDRDLDKFEQDTKII